MLHHLEINVHDLQRSCDFWGWLLETLGYSPFQRWEGGRSWKQGECYLVFVQTEARYLDAPYHRRQTGLNHLAFHVDTRATLDNLRTQLEARGVQPLYQERYPHAGGPDHCALFFEDPDRIKVELVSQPET